MSQPAQFLKESYSELRQSTWLSREQAVQFTKVVIVIVAIMSAYVALVDWVLATFIRGILGH